MSLGAALVLIVLIIAIAGVIKNRRSVSGHHPAEDEANRLREAELRREVEQLRERVQVLERIATEGSEARRLSAEIERLRDER